MNQFDKDAAIVTAIIEKGKFTATEKCNYFPSCNHPTIKMERLKELQALTVPRSIANFAKA